MPNNPSFVRPPLSEALDAWKRVLAKRKFPTDIVWIFDENLCFERRDDKGDSVTIGFQTQITPPPPEAEKIAFDYFSQFEARIVFYRLGNSGGKSICLMLCDEWFENKDEKDGYIRRDDWLISFCPGTEVELEQVNDEKRWKQRVLRNRPLHDLDFSMTLRGVHEILAHGRVLTSYEHYALRLLNVWRQFVGEKR